MRKFIRHPTCVPIDIAVGSPVALEAVGSEPRSLGPPEPANMINISAGGLAFALHHPVAVGAPLTISMPQIWPDYSARGTVVWCRGTGEGYEAGVQFGEANEAFKARMVAQFCQIEDYRREMREQHGRLLSSEEAAQEWIVQYAEEFAETVGWQ